MKALIFDAIGSEADKFDVVALRDIPAVAPGRHEVVVKMLLAPVNWSDFLFIGGRYPEPRVPRLPGQIAGITGVGVVVEGGAATRIAPGTVVSFSHPGSWADFTSVPEAALIPVPKGLPLHIAAQIGNPLTAWDLLRMANLGPGGTIVLTAAYANVARCVAQLAARSGLRVIGTARRLSPEGRPAGYDAVLELSDEGLEAPGQADAVLDRVMTATGGRAPDVIVDCVGGPALGLLARSLAPYGKIITYGTLTGGDLGLNNPLIMSKFLSLQAYGYRYFSTMPAADAHHHRQALAALTEQPFSLPPPADLHGLDDFRLAIDRHFDGARHGKQVFRIADHAEIEEAAAKLGLASAFG